MRSIASLITLLFSLRLVMAVAQDILEDKDTKITGIIHANSTTCGGVRATKEVFPLSGPNGHIDWLNCGFEADHGWQPPHVRMEDIITHSLSSAFKKPGSPFKTCSQYIKIFEKYGGKYNIPPIILASFAMQESSCQPDSIGGGGEQGLMQISAEKCVGAPNPGGCREPDFNIHTATKYFAETLKKHKGNVLLSVGTYNGWYPGLTKRDAFAAANSACCRCQNNGDYLHQFFNGWCQNIDVYDGNMHLGKYFNLDRCQ